MQRNGRKTLQLIVLLLSETNIYTFAVLCYHFYKIFFLSSFHMQLLVPFCTQKDIIQQVQLKTTSLIITFRYRDKLSIIRVAIKLNTNKFKYYYYCKSDVLINKRTLPMKKRE